MGGKISAKELRKVLERMGADPMLDEVMMMMNDLDCKETGYMDFDEFVLMMGVGADPNVLTSPKKPRGPGRGRTIDDAFSLVDLDGSGAVSREEFETLLKVVGESMSKVEMDALWNPIPK